MSSLRVRFPRVDMEALAAGTRKQATIPRRATVLEPVGTAPGLVVPPASGVARSWSCFPGPPRELQPMWRASLETDPMRPILSRAHELRQGVIRLFGLPESELAGTLRDAQAAGIPLDQLEITTCLHRGELEVTTSYEQSAEGTYEAFADFLEERHRDTIFARDERPSRSTSPRSCWTGAHPGDRRVLHRRAGRGTADRPIPGLEVPARRGGRLRERGEGGRRRRARGTDGGVRRGLPEVAAAMAHGARDRLGADVASA